MVLPARLRARLEQIRQHYRPSRIQVFLEGVLARPAAVVSALLIRRVVALMGHYATRGAARGVILDRRCTPGISEPTGVYLFSRCATENA